MQASPLNWRSGLLGWELESNWFAGVWLRNHEQSNSGEDLADRAIMPFQSRFEFIQFGRKCTVVDYQLTKVDEGHTTNTLIFTARGEFSTVAAMIAPCSVKACGGNFACCPRFKVTICDLKELLFSVVSI